MSLRDLGRLLRLSLLPSALADVAGGVVLGNLGHWPVGAGPWWLLGSSACVYHGAMALNDWRDREHDRATRPTRPIPSGAVPAGTALTLALLLLGFGPLLALQHSREAALWSLGLSLLAASYDLVGRGPLLGPLLLAACRAGNLGLGLFLGSGELGGGAPTRLLLAPLALYGLYVLRVSQLGRLEDGEAALGPPGAGQDFSSAALGGRPRGLVSSAATMLLLVPLIPPFEPLVISLEARAVAAALAWPAAVGLFLAAFRGGDWSRGRVESTMGLALRRLSIFGACCAALAWRRPVHDGLIVAAAILVGLGLAVRLRRVFPPS